jgi:hypothetical protein
VVLLCFVLSALLAAPAAAQEAPDAPDANSSDTPTPSTGPTTPPKPSIGLDRLLQLPTRRPYDQDPRTGGKDRETWVGDFADAREEVRDLEEQIEENSEKLRGLSRSDWGFSPTGGGPPTDPEVLAVRAQLKRDRESLETARRRLRDLEIEASLAGVPADWTRPEAAATSTKPESP